MTMKKKKSRGAFKKGSKKLKKGFRFKKGGGVVKIKKK